MQALRSLIGATAAWALATGLGALPAAAAHEGREGATTAAPPIFVDGRNIHAPGIVDRRRILVPVRGVFEAVDADVQYSPPRFVVVRREGAVIAAFMLDRRRAIVGHRSLDLDVAPTQRDGRVYVPLRTVAEAAGATVVYGSHPPTVQIRRATVASTSAETAAEPTGSRSVDHGSVVQWRLGVAVFSALCCVGVLVITARRYGTSLRPPAPSSRVLPVPPAAAAAAPPPPIPAASPAPPDEVALTRIESSGEARLRKEVVTETRTIEVPITREELVIEYAGTGGTVIVEGRPLHAGETVRIPLWEERVHVDVKKHVLVAEDITIDKRRARVSGPPADRAQPSDFSLAEGSPS